MAAARLGMLLSQPDRLFGGTCVIEAVSPNQKRAAYAYTDSFITCSAKVFLARKGSSWNEAGVEFGRPPA